MNARTISTAKADKLFWLGRYAERTYLNLHLLRAYYDKMIDGDAEAYEEYCNNLSLDADFKSPSNFVKSFLYDKQNPKLCSWPKVVRYVRNCRDESDENFARCAEICAQVQGWAKHEKDGVERVWRSLAQQLKLSHGKKPKSGLAPCAVPDRSWA